MVTESTLELPQIKGPTGFMELDGSLYVVDYGKIYLGSTLVGFLFEDGYLKDTLGPLGESSQYRPIDELAGCTFRGIDSDGNELNLPGSSVGPTGNLIYNKIRFNVINGRISTMHHRLVGTLDDLGIISIRSLDKAGGWLKLDQNTQLSTFFEGKKSTGTPWRYDFMRPLYRRERSYADNETIRYFVGFDALSSAQKKYVFETMSIWAASGILQVVRKSEGDASLGNIKHGAAGVTGVRTGNATFDREEFEKDVELYNRYGPLLVAAKGTNCLEVRLSMVVAHEFGHQLEFTLTQAMQEKITDLFNQKRATCTKLHPPPQQYKGYSELLMTHQIEQRHFISGYAKTSMHEYWAESVAAFSAKSSRDTLRKFDPAMHQFLTDIILRPTTMLRVVLHETITALQASLRLGEEFTEDLLDK